MALIPRRLVMTRAGCFYCDADDDIRICLINHLFGLKACYKHFNNAERDCNAYMHENNMVKIEDGLMNENVKKFFEILGENFRVLRSNGQINENWKLCKNTYTERYHIQKVEGMWAFPITDDYYSKMMPFRYYLKKELGYVSEKLEEIIKNIEEDFDKGLYIDYYKSQPKPEEVDDHSKIKQIFMSNGEEINIIKVFDSTK